MHNDFQGHPRSLILHQFKAHKGLDCAVFYVPANTV